MMAAMIKLMWGMLPSYLSERFPTKRRASGLGFGFSSGTLIGAWFSAYAWWIHGIPFIKSIEREDMWLSPAVVLVVGAIMCFFAMLCSPETKDLDLSEIKEAMPLGAAAAVAAEKKVQPESV